MSDVTRSREGGVIGPAEVVREKMVDLLRRYPELISFDPADEKYEQMLIRCKIDPGPGRSERDGWEGEVCDWYTGTYTMVDQDTGELVTLPSLVLLTSDGGLVRITNSEPAMRSWLMILRELGAERVRRGLRVRLALRESQTAGRHYWQILPV